MVCIVCWSLRNFITAEHGRYGSMEYCGVSNAEYLVHLMEFGGTPSVVNH